MNNDPVLTCPSCAFVAPLAEFLPPAYASRFAERAFVILTIVMVLSVMRGLGLLTVKRRTE